MRSFLVIVVFCTASVSAGNFLLSIRRCAASDPKLNECIRHAIETNGPAFIDGVLELGIEPLDPVQLGTVRVDNPALKIVFTDTVVTGLRRFKINDYKISLEKGKAMMNFTANVTLKANYDMNGKIIILPIRGNGQAKIQITNLNIVIRYDFTTRDGHWTVTSYKNHYKMDRAQFKFTNLFDGNKQLGDSVHAAINSNWESVIRDLGPVAFEQIIKACVEETKKLFAAVPLDQLLLP